MAQLVGLNEDEFSVFSELELASFSVLLHCRRRVPPRLLMLYIGAYVGVYAQVRTGGVRRQGRIQRTGCSRLSLAWVQPCLVQSLFAHHRDRWSTSFMRRYLGAASSHGPARLEELSRYVVRAIGVRHLKIHHDWTGCSTPILKTDGCNHMTVSD